MIKTIIFDMDGVLVDSLKYHWIAWEKTVEALGATYPKELDSQINGMSMKNSIELINKHSGQTLSYEEADRLKRDNVREFYFSKVEMFPGAYILLEELRKKGYNIAIASSSQREFIELVLDKFRIRQCFGFSISGDEVENSKPNPEIFLKCAEHFGSLPEECVVIEDAISGVEAAKNAGMKAIAVTTSHSREELSKADVIVENISLAGKTLF